MRSWLLTFSWLMEFRWLMRSWLLWLLLSESLEPCLSSAEKALKIFPLSASAWPD